MNKKYKELRGANMDIDLISDNLNWKQDQCPWNKEEGHKKHKCAIKNTSICPYFKGIKDLDTIICSYPNK